jgi:hypothetical protein
MARHCGSKHHELVVYKPMLWPGWNRASVSSACRGPVPSIRAVAAERIKLALSGLGADEFSGGVPLPSVDGLVAVPELVPIFVAPEPAPGTQPSGCLQTLSCAPLGQRPQSYGGCAVPLQWPASATQLITQGWVQTSWAELFAYS